MKIETKASFEGKEVNSRNTRDLPYRYDSYRLDELELKFTFKSMSDFKDFKVLLTSGNLEKFASVHQYCFWSPEIQEKINLSKKDQVIFPEHQKSVPQIKPIRVNSFVLIKETMIYCFVMRVNNVVYLQPCKGSDDIGYGKGRNKPITRKELYETCIAVDNIQALPTSGEIIKNE